MRLRLLEKFLVYFVTVFGISCRVLPGVKQDITDNPIKLNGSSFFPLAMYTWCPDIITDSNNAELDILKGAGFNLIDVKFKDTAKDTYLGFMERCQARGINLLIEGNTEEATRGSNEPLFFKSIIEKYGSHPALFGFSISDDANNGKYPISNLRSLNSKVKEWDKNAHYTVCSTYPRYKRSSAATVNPAGFFGITDLLFFQTYPIGSWAQYSDPPDFTPDEELYQNEMDCFLLQSNNINNSPWVTTPQTFSWSFFHENRIPRLPATDELRNIVYVGLNNGAKGVIYYELHIPESATTNRPEIKLYKNDSLWDEIKSINSELKIIQDVLMFGKRNKFITLSWTSASSWEYKGSTYIVVANLHKTSPQHVEYEINATGTLSNFFKDRSASLSFANKQLTGIIPPKQVQVYKIN